MHWFSRVPDGLRRRNKDGGSGPRWVRAIPGVVPRSPLESRIQAILATHTGCTWEHLTAQVAAYLRSSESPVALAVLGEGIWGKWLWRAVAREELRRLEGVLLATGGSSPRLPTSIPSSDQSDRVSLLMGRGRPG